MTARIKLRRDSSANWSNNNPILALGEAGYDTDNNQIRVGNGTSAWNDLLPIGAGANLDELSVDAFTLRANETNNFLSLGQGDDHVRLGTEGTENIYLTTNYGTTDGNASSYDVPQAGSHTWTFGGDGNLTAPGNIDVQRPITGRIFEQASDSYVWGTQNVVDGDNVYVVGGFYDSDWDGEDRPSVTKYSKTGERLWIKTFEDDGSKFYGYSYAIALRSGNVLVTFYNGWDNRRFYVVELSATDGSVIAQESYTDELNNNYFYPRSLNTRGSKWVAAGEMENTVSKLAAIKTMGPGSGSGFAFLPKSYFPNNNYPDNGGNWSIRKTYSPNSADSSTINEVNQYNGVPVFNLTGSGVNANIWLRYSPLDGTSNQYGWDSNTGTGYTLNDVLYVKGTDVGAHTDQIPMLITGATWSWNDGAGRNDFATADDAVAGTINTDLTINPGNVWKVMVKGYNTTNFYNLTAISGSAGSWIISTDGDNFNLGAATDLVFYCETTGTGYILVPTYVSDPDGYLYSFNLFGTNNTDRVKLTTYGPYYDESFQTTFTNVPGNDGSDIAQVTVLKTDLPYWYDVSTDSTWTVDCEGYDTRQVTNSYDANDGYITFYLNDVTGGQGKLVTLTSTLGKYEVTHSTDNNALIIGSDGVNFSWGGDGNQRFNVAGIGSDDSIYGAGHDNYYDRTLVAKFNSAGTQLLWHTSLQNSDTGYDDDCHGLVVTTEDFEGPTEFVYVAGYDDASGVTVYKLLGSNGAVQWATTLGGYNSSNSNYGWQNAASLAVATNGDIVVAGRVWSPNAPDQTKIGVFVLNSVTGALTNAKEISFATNSIDTRYNGDEADYQFVINHGTDNVDYFVASNYIYRDNSSSITIRVPLYEVGTFSSTSGFAELDVLENYPVVSSFTNYTTGTLENPDATPSPSDLTRRATNNYMAPVDAYFVGNPNAIYTPTVWNMFSGDTGHISGVNALVFEDGTEQTSAYNPLMGRVTNSDYWYYPKPADAGKFMPCAMDGNSGYYVGLYDDAGAPDLQVGFAVTIIAPYYQDIYIRPRWYNDPPMIIAPGQTPIQNTSQYSGWILRAGGMATVLKVASNTWYVTGGKLDAE